MSDVIFSTWDMVFLMSDVDFAAFVCVDVMP